MADIPLNSAAIKQPGRHRLRLALLTLSLISRLVNAGPTVPELLPIEQAMTNYMAGKNFQAGTIALMKNSRLVLRQGYGWRNSNLTLPIHPDNKFRLASVSKTITGSAIRKLISAGQLSSSTRVYSYLGIPPWGGMLGDTRITNITVQHLLDHAGGWNRDASSIGDAVFSTITISSNLALSYPAAPSNVISWMFSKPLDFTPGTTNVYSNFGYQLLGRVVEKAGGKSYMNYLQQNLLGPFGITNIIQSRSRPADRDPWEIWYADSPALYRSAVDYPTNLFVRWADGGGYYESFDAFGGLSASAPALCQYMLNYWVGGAQRVPASSYNWTYVFYGSLPATTAVIHQSIMQNSSATNGLEFAVLFNRRTGGNDNDEAHTAIENAATNVTSWPTNGGGMIQWNVASTNTGKNGPLNVQLVRSGLANLPVKISYMTFGVTAGSTNYVPASGIVSFAPGETVKNIPITILNSGYREPTKQFLLELLSASGGAWLGPRVSCAVNIVDDSTAPLFSAQPNFSGGSFKARVTGGTGLVMRVQYSTNLLSWSTLQTITNTSGSFDVIDNTAPNRARSFYRIIVP